MQSLKKFYFGKSKYKPNTFIGGVSGTINTKELLASRLAVSVASIKLFVIKGLDIEAHVSQNYGFNSDAFFNNHQITYFRDIDGKVLNLNSSNVFRSASNLVEVYFPNVVRATTIESNGNVPAFRDCTSLTTVYMPNLTKIEWSMFQGCTSLVSLNLPKVDSVRIYGLNGCTNLTTVSFPLLTEIRSFGFINSKISTINFPNLISIGDSAFEGCSSLSSVTVNPLYADIKSRTFLGCSSLTSLTFNGVTTINTSCFQSCSNLAVLNLPNLITIIGGINTSTYVFTSTKLTALNFPELTTISGGFLCSNNPSLKTFYFPKCNSLGDSSGDNGVFFGTLAAGSTITIRSELQTNNAGSPDGDLLVAISKGASIVYL